MILKINIFDPTPSCWCLTACWNFWFSIILMERWKELIPTILVNISQKDSVLFNKWHDLPCLNTRFYLKIMSKVKKHKELSLQLLKFTFTSYWQVCNSARFMRCIAKTFLWLKFYWLYFVSALTSRVYIVEAKFGFCTLNIKSKI